MKSKRRSIMGSNEVIPILCENEYTSSSLDQGDGMCVFTCARVEQIGLLTLTYFYLYSCLRVFRYKYLGNDDGQKEDRAVWYFKGYIRKLCIDLLLYIYVGVWITWFLRRELKLNTFAVHGIRFNHRYRKLNHV